MLNGGVGYSSSRPRVKRELSSSGIRAISSRWARTGFLLFVDTGRVDVVVAWASGEKTRTLFGYSPKPVNVTAINGSTDSLSWSPSTQLFTVNVHPTSAGTAHVRITQAAAARRQPTAATAVALENPPQ